MGTQLAYVHTTSHICLCVTSTIPLCMVQDQDLPTSSHTLYQMRLHPSVTFTALLLLQYLKICLPAIPGSFCQCLFITAFMIASKVISDDKYSNKFWSIIGQGMFQLWKINWMEWEFCQYLNWEVNVDADTLMEFEDMVQKVFADLSPYPALVFPAIPKHSTSTMNPFLQWSLTTPPCPTPSLTPDMPPHWSPSHCHISRIQTHNLHTSPLHQHLTGIPLVNWTQWTWCHQHHHRCQQGWLMTLLILQSQTTTPWNC